MNIWSAIEELINVVEVGTGTTERDESRVTYLLDYLALEIHRIDITGDFDGEEIPENDYPAIRKAAEKRFPNWGFYNVPKDVTQNVMQSELLTGDAIDDITDIVNDLKMVFWSFKNENEATALWHLLDSYNGHWRWHMRNLQVYIHCLENDI